MNKIRYLINARYVVTNDVEVQTKTGELCEIKNKTILTVNRFENDVPILRWMSFDLKKFVEIEGTEDFSINLTNYVY